jgi:hypothetical protein
VGGGKAAWVALALLSALALGVRLVGLDFLLPGLLEPDNNIALQAELLERGEPHPEADWRFGSYPLFVARCAAALPRRAAMPDSGAGLEEHLRAASSWILRARLAVALLSVLIVPGTFFLARRFLGPGWSLFAAALMAASLLDTSFAQQARPHAPLASMTLLALLAALRLRRAPTPVAYVVAGLAAGAAVGTLHNGLAVLPALAVAWLLRRREHGRASGAWILATLAIVAIWAWRLYPTLFASLGRASGGGELDLAQRRVAQGEHEIFLVDFDGSGLRLTLEALWLYEPVALLLAGLGLARGVFALARGARAGRERARDLAVVLAFALPYLAVLGAFARTLERFTLPLLPLLACLAAYGAAGAAELATRALPAGRARRVAASAVAIALLAFPAAATAKLALARSRPTTLAEAARFIREHATPAERVLVTPGLDLPLFSGAEALRSNRELLRNPQSYPRITNWFRHQARALDQGLELDPAEPRWQLFWIPPRPLESGGEAAVAEYLRSFDGDWLALEVFGPDRGQPFMDALRSGAASLGRRVARFEPEPGAQALFAYEDISFPPRWHSALRTLRIERTGPVIEVYDLRRLAGRNR